jgi:hypothetical protein
MGFFKNLGLSIKTSAGRPLSRADIYSYCDGFIKEPPVPPELLATMGRTLCNVNGVPMTVTEYYREQFLKPALEDYRGRNCPPVRRPPKHPAVPLGPVAAMVRAGIDRISDIARAIGPYEAFVTVMTITGMVGLRYTTDPWPVVSLVGFGLTAPLIAKFVRRP